MNWLPVIALVLMTLLSNGQRKSEYNGQAILTGSYHPDNDLEWLSAGRYIPELKYSKTIDTIKAIDLLGAVNLHGNAMTNFQDSSTTDGDIKPYRIWLRYTSNQLEVRAGLQKIDFGSASILRPLQWFNQIDPRDPLSLTNGVYGLLGRYYFLNNANIWLWGLLGNKERRGFDAVGTNHKMPEFGTRVQYPVSKGEIALSYHHRTASTKELGYLPVDDKIPEDRIGIDGKWDIGVGLWFEASYIHKSKNTGILTNQALFNLGTDYTFGLGNGLNLIVEHLLLSYDSHPFDFANVSNITAASASYPFSMFDHLNSVFYYSWKTDDLVFFLNYEHQFANLTGYVMAFYNPDTQSAFQQNDLLTNFAGPGFRIMLVYNH